MSVITFSESLGVGKFTWGQQRRDLSFNSLFGSQSVGISSPLWMVSITSSNSKESDAGAWQSLLLKLSGKVNQLELWNVMRPSPIGTMRGTMTLNAAAAQGDVALSIIAASEAAKTLKAGDLLGMGSGTTQQVVMVLDDAVANGSGVISVNINPALRNAFAGGASVVWDKPKALFRQSATKASWDYAQGRAVGGMSLDLIEDWRA
ncbi:MAG: hypothetical protein WCT35_04920 [Sideroxydans sp.]|jgi:hypothetical protein